MGNRKEAVRQTETTSLFPILLVRFYLRIFLGLAPYGIFLRGEENEKLKRRGEKRKEGREKSGLGHPSRLSSAAVN